ncbi:MAG: hypothetical protein JOZ80_09440 [Acidobacteriaceae bacterium]|nr:hypothetical protein [Acidobacteriaceae bacterium]
MVEDPKWELAILATVQGFYEKLLQEPVGGEVPVPSGLEAVSLQSDEDVAGTLSAMHRWLKLLDMAISPALLRCAFSEETDPEIAEAMLRYFTRKKDAAEATRDKTDLVATFLYRHPRVAGQWEQRGYGLDGSLPLSPFEIALIEILSDAEVPPLSDEHSQLLRQFDKLQDEAQNARDLNVLLESGIIPRVRELKRSFENAFYHPGVLATIARYNATFGRRFDELFREATTQIKRFASELEEQGGTILGTVDGVDVTVEHVASLKENELLRIDYANALEKFRRVSRLRKTLEQRPPMRRIAKPSVTATENKPSANRKLQTRPSLDIPAVRAAVTPQQISSEEAKLSRVEESIRVFVRVADPKFRQVVPMRFFNLILTPAEAEAFSADYLQEKSLRAEVARAILRLVSVGARMTTELEELRRAENSPSLWRLHGESLAVLLEIERTAHEATGRVISSAKQQGNTNAVETLQASQKKLNDCSELVLKTLAPKPAEKAVSAVSGN